jgi:hypothetical protein
MRREERTSGPRSPGRSLKRNRSYAFAHTSASGNTSYVETARKRGLVGCRSAPSSCEALAATKELSIDASCASRETSTTSCRFVLQKLKKIKNIYIEVLVGGEGKRTDRRWMRRRASREKNYRGICTRFCAARKRALRRWERRTATTTTTAAAVVVIVGVVPAAKVGCAGCWVE